MVDYLEEIKELEAEIKKTQYNKATQHHIGLVKAKIAKLRESQERRASSGKKGKGYDVRKTGDGTVILVGYPSVGKSTLLNALTNAQSKVGSYDFTTLSVIPGVMHYGHAKIQILDVPGIVRGASVGTGRGKEVLAVMRNSDLIMLIIDVAHPEHKEYLSKEIWNAGIRMNQKKPDVQIKRTSKDGISLGTTVRLTKIDQKTIEAILREFKMTNADVLIREDIDADQLIDCIEANKVYLPSITVVNKIDLAPRDKALEAMKSIKAEIGISAKNKSNIDDLKKFIFDRLDLIPIYLKEPGKEADMKEPLIMMRGSSLRDLCSKLHKDFVSKFRFAKIWGKSVKFSGQRVTKISHPIASGDVIELHIG